MGTRRPLNRLREIREARGVKAVDLAEAMRISSTYLYKLEDGSKRLNEDHLRRAARYLNVSTDEILGFDPKPSKTRNLSYLNAPDPGTALNRALQIAEEESWTHDDLREAIRTLADRWGFFPGGATRPEMAANW